MYQRRLFIFVTSLSVMLFLFLVPVHDAAATSFTIPNRQPWNFVNGPCAGLDGAVFAVVGTGCGGPGTSFDTAEVFSPVVIKDIATVDTPCDAIFISIGETCYRMWYVGSTETWAEDTRIGYALSPDGLTWTRVPGPAALGSVLDESGETGRFDRQGVAYMSIMKDGGVFKMWYTGYNDDSANPFPNILNIGYAESTDGQNWTRIDGPLAGAAVLRASEVPGTFDREQALVPNVIKGIATAEAPCAGVTLGETCYRMWYEGARDDGGFRFFIGYATSPDGLNWTRVPGPETEGANLGVAPFPQFDASSAGISIVLKDGDLYRMWYEAKDFDNIYTIGHVVSVTGTNWVRPVPNVEVFGGADDPALPDPDNAWSHWVMKDGARYKMWYTTSTRGEPASDRIAYASMVPGTAMVMSRNAAAAPTYSLTFTTTVSLPEEGFVLITLPPDVYASVITATLGLAGFAAGATLVADDYAITDAAAASVVRGALLVRLANPEPAGSKTVTFTLSAPIALETTVVVQTFDSREVWQYGLIDLQSGALAVQLSQVGAASSGLVWPAAILTGLSLLTLVYWVHTRPNEA